jgi:hypothetical protein
MWYADFYPERYEEVVNLSDFPRAVLSEDKLHRYVLRRTLSATPSIFDGSEEIRSMCFIMLNPSTADAEEDDPTIRRCMSFARREQCLSMFVVNLFAFRTPYPKLLIKAADPIGSENDTYTKDICNQSDFVIAAWGSHPFARERAEYVMNMLGDVSLKCLGVTKDGWPRHPLYVSGDTKLEDWGFPG